MCSSCGSVGAICVHVRARRTSSNGTPLRPVNSVSGWKDASERTREREMERKDRRLLNARIPAVYPLVGPSLSLSPSISRAYERRVPGDANVSPDVAATRVTRVTNFAK